MTTNTLKNFETANFKLVTAENGTQTLKATSPMSKAYLKLKKNIALDVMQGTPVAELLLTVGALETGVAKLAAI